MTQTIQLESLASFGDRGWKERIRACSSQLTAMCRAKMHRYLDLALGYVANHPRQMSRPARYACIHRHTWCRYSALIVAHEQQLGSSRTNTKPRSMQEGEQVATRALGGTLRFQVTAVRMQPVWASAVQDWTPFE